MTLLQTHGDPFCTSQRKGVAGLTCKLIQNPEKGKNPTLSSVLKIWTSRDSTNYIVCHYHDISQSILFGSWIIAYKKGKIGRERDGNWGGRNINWKKGKRYLGKKEESNVWLKENKERHTCTHGPLRNPKLIIKKRILNLEPNVYT